MGKKIVIVIAMSLLFSLALFAQGVPKPVIQEVYDIGGSYPDNIIYPADGTIEYEVWIASRPQYIMKLPNKDLGGSAKYDSIGRFILSFNLANFLSVGSPSDWQVGDVVRIRISQPSTGRWASAEFTIEAGSMVLRYKELAAVLKNKPTLKAPSELAATFESDSVKLTWKSPVSPALEGDDDASRAELIRYDVYRDHVKINKRPVFEPTFMDSDVVLDNVYLYYVKAVYMEGESDRSNTQVVDLVGVDEDILVTPLVTGLKGNHPNPFNPDTNISFEIAEPGNVTIAIYNSRGQKVKTLLNDHVGAGKHTAHWDGRDENNRSVSSGIYFYRMQKGSYSSSKKMIMMK
jgi:hypothetical protein